MNAGFLADWTTLWRIAATVGEPSSAFEGIGLFLEDPAEPRRGGYDDTPPHSVMFASTGGDGVHFSFLPTAAVVMTAPTAFDSPNHVLGADLREFLALGCHTGYFALDRLAYGWGREQAIAALGSAPAPADPLLRRLIDAFGLRPWPDVAGRLAELR